ncbi:hypothetical protein GCM10023205_19670 [Yinghuangia aomiensis]|uniref:Uncharacterized protein n=1 Tax=Yinghuangia aomiensis TaxID=676205 RepID=A0ABP9GZ93_9ACTN
MVPKLFLNEQSCETVCDKALAREAMTELMLLVVEMAQRDKHGTWLACEYPLNALMIAEGYSFSEWRGQVDRDLRNRFLKVQDRAPLSAVFPDGETFAEYQYWYGGKEARGLGAAHLMNGLGVSLPLAQCWESPIIGLDCRQMVETESGDLICLPTAVDVRHASRRTHMDHHQSWIQEQLDALVRTGADIWEHREALYPHLQFLPRVQALLEDLQPVWVHPAAECLKSLDASAEAWDVTKPFPEWNSEVTPEGETRKRLCVFEDLDGESRTFDLHARFTPRPGRVHFRLIPGDRAIRIAHVGRKLGV